MDRVVDVIGIAYARDDTLRDVVQHIFKGINLVVLTPGGHGGVLGGGNADAGHVGAVVLLQQFDGGEVVRAPKIEEVRRTADGRGFTAAHAAEAKVVQLEGQQSRITGAHKRLANSLLYGSAERCHGDRIPDLKQNRFRPIRQPVKFWVGVFEGDDGVLRGNERAFLDRLNPQRQDSPVFRVQAFPACIVKTLRISAEMFVSEFSGFLDVFAGKNFAGKVGFRDVLQSGHLRVIEKTAARADVGIDEARVRRVLPPMRELVAISIEDRIEAKGLNDSSDCRLAKAGPLHFWFHED